MLGCSALLPSPSQILRQNIRKVLLWVFLRKTGYICLSLSFKVSKHYTMGSVFEWSSLLKPELAERRRRIISLGVPFRGQRSALTAALLTPGKYWRRQCCCCNLKPSWRVSLVAELMSGKGWGPWQATESSHLPKGRISQSCTVPYRCLSNLCLKPPMGRYDEVLAHVVLVFYCTTMA